MQNLITQKKATIGGKNMDLKKVDFEKINSLTPDEIIIANILDKAAKEANAAVELIYDTYKFHMGEEKIELARNGQSNYEYLTYDGKWVGVFAKKPTYTVKCSKEESDIYAYLYAKSLLEGGYVRPEDFFSEDVTYAEMNVVAIYLCNFIERTKRIANTENAKKEKNGSSKKSGTSSTKKPKAEAKES